MANIIRKLIAMAMTICMLISMVPVQALAEGTSEDFQLENVEGTLTVEGNTVTVEFTPAGKSDGEAEWESELTQGETIKTEVTDVTVTTQKDGNTTVVTENVTIENEGTLEDGTTIEGQETVTETTTTVTDVSVKTDTKTTTKTVVDEEGNEIEVPAVTETTTKTKKDYITSEVVAEGNETTTNPAEQIAPGEEVPSVTVPVPGSDEVDVEKNVEGEVIEEKNEDGSTTTSQTNQMVTEEVDEATGSVTTTETITTTESVKSPEKEQPESGDIITETTTTTTIEKTTEESADGEVTGEKVNVNVTVTKDVSEISGDVKEGEDDPNYDYTVTTETTEREVDLEIVNNGIVVEDVNTGLVGEQNTALKPLAPVYDENDNYVDANKDGVADDKLNGEHVGKKDVFDRNYLSSQKLDKVVLKNGIVIWVNDTDKIITNITAPEGTEIPEDFEYSVGSSVKDWYTRVEKNPVKSASPKNATIKTNVLDSETGKKYDQVTLENGIVVILDDDSKTVVNVKVPEGMELPEDFAYGVGTDVTAWYTNSSSNPYEESRPANSSQANNVSINNIANWYDSKGNLIHAPAGGGEFAYVGTGEHSKFYTANVYVTYKKDADGNTIYENGEPVIESIKTAKNGADVTIDGVLATELPEGVSLEPIYDNYGGSRPTMFMLMDQHGNRVYAYCCDIETGTAKGHWYSVSNLEDSGYYASKESENHIRSIALNGYWGTSDMPKEDGSYETGSLERIKQNLRDAINSGEMENEVIQMPAVDENGDPVLDAEGNPVMESRTMLELIDEMTEGEALLATQAAIWSYANGSFDVKNGKDGKVIIDPDGYKWNQDPKNGSKDGEALNDYGSARVDFLYKWLINLDTEEEKVTVINEQNFVEDVTLTVHEKVEDETIEANYDDDDTNDVYNTDLNFRLAFIPGENDDLLVQITYTDLDGNPINIVRRLAGENAEGQNYEDILPEEDGSYILKGLKLSENENFDFDLRLEGTQYLEQGVYVYAPVGGRDKSQTFVGVAEGERNVDISASMTISFDVDEHKQVVARREWKKTSDPIESVDTTRNTTITEPQVMYRVAYGVGQLETIIDEEVPLAEVPQTGDNSVMWFALILLSGCGLWILQRSDKKCKA